MDAIVPGIRRRIVPDAPAGCLLSAAPHKGAGTVTVTGKGGKTATMDYNRNKLPDYSKDVPVYSANIVMQIISDKD